MKVTRVRNSVVGKVGASVLAIAGALGACDSTDEQLRALELGGHCLLDSECLGDLVCVFARCHAECDEDEDCEEVGGRCVRVPQEDREQSTTVGVCQLPDQSGCEIDDDCKGKQVCAPDLQCRDICSSSSNPCFPGFACAASGQCALYAELNAKGELNPATKEPGGSGGAGGVGGDGAGSDAGGSSGMATVSTGGSSASGGKSSTGGGGDASAGESSTGGTSSEGGSSSGGDGPGGGTGTGGDGGAPNGGIIYDYIETSDGVELVANNDYDHPIPINNRVKVYLTGDDEDWLALTPPKDGRAHIVSLHVEQDTPLSAQVIVRSQTDFSEIDRTHFSAGVTSFAYVTAGPNTTLLFGFVRYPIGGSVGFADVTFDVVAENDVHEPNNTKTEAARIAVGSTVSGQILHPYSSEIDRPKDDWYAIDLQPGTATVQILDTPDEGGFSVSRTALNGAVTSLGSAPEGGTASLDFAVPEAGTYYLQVIPNTSSALLRLVAFSYGAKPAYLDQQYSFVVTQ